MATLVISFNDEWFSTIFYSITGFMSQTIWKIEEYHPRIYLTLLIMFLVFIVIDAKNTSVENTRSLKDAVPTGATTEKIWTTDEVRPVYVKPAVAAKEE